MALKHKVYRRSRIEHRNKPPAAIRRNKSLARVVTEHLLQLVVYALPLAAGVWLGNSLLANKSAEQRNLEMQRNTWKQLAEDLKSSAERFYEYITSDFAILGERDSVIASFDTWKLPSTTSTHALTNTIDQIFLYGQSFDDTRITNQCRIVLSSISAIEQRRSSMIDYSKYVADVYGVDLEYLKDNDREAAVRIMADRIDAFVTKDEIESDFADTFDELNKDINTLILMMFDSTYDPTQNLSSHNVTASQD